MLQTAQITQISKLTHTQLTNNNDTHTQINKSTLA